MSNYPGRRKNTRRVVIWAKLPGEARSRQLEWIVEGTKRDGEAFEARKRTELAAGQPVEFRTAPSFFDFCDSHYKPHAKKHLKASTWEKVRRYQVATLCEHIGSLRLTAISTATVEDYKQKRLASKTVQASSINNELRVLRTILNWAKELGVPCSIVRWKKLPVRGKGRCRVWTAEQCQSLYEETRKRAPTLVPVLVFLLNTGCRKGEAIAAEWSWMDLEGGMVRIPSNEVWQPKNGLPREVPMGDAVRAILSGPRRHPRWVFPNTQGSRYAEFPKDLFSDIRKKASLTGGPHTTRHTYSSHFLKVVPDLFLLAQVLGHSHQRVTELYSHMLPDHLARARNAVNLAPTMALTMAEKSGQRKKTAKTH